MVERLSFVDGSLFGSHAEFAQQYEFAARYCFGKSVLDAGCGSGYGSFLIARKCAANVVGVDVSEEAITEASRLYRRPNLSYRRADLEKLDSQRFDVVVNVGTLPHLKKPEAFLRAVSPTTLITSTPNRETSALDDTGKPLYPFHYWAFSEIDFFSLLERHFDRVERFGQWLTPDGQLRKLRTHEAFVHLCNIYYSPASRVSRVIKRMLGRPLLGPPTASAARDSYAGDHTIGPLADPPFPWSPTTFIAVCN